MPLFHNVLRDLNRSRDTELWVLLCYVCWGALCNRMSLPGNGEVNEEVSSCRWESVPLPVPILAQKLHRQLFPSGGLGLCRHPQQDQAAQPKEPPEGGRDATSKQKNSEAQFAIPCQQEGNSLGRFRFQSSPRAGRVVLPPKASGSLFLGITRHREACLRFPPEINVFLSL